MEWIEMKTHPDCLPCVMRQALEASRMATDDKAIQERVLRRVAEELSETSFEDPPLVISHRAQRIVREMTGVDDPYKDLKEEFNERAMDMYPDLKERVSESEDPLLTAAKLAIAGNVIDFGPDRDFDLEGTVEDVLSRDLAVDHFDRLRDEIENSGEIYYLADNSGEIVFDRLLIEEMEGKEVRFFVKGGPVLNDATAGDAEEVGIDEIAEIEEVFSSDGRAGLDEISEDFIDRVEDAELVISKGQGNYEAFSEVDANIFYMLLVKCSLVGDDLGAELGDVVIY